MRYRPFLEMEKLKGRICKTRMGNDMGPLQYFDGMYAVCDDDDQWEDFTKIYSWDMESIKDLPFPIWSLDGTAANLLAIELGDIVAVEVDSI